ncbi:MAG: hypothetical protein ACI8W8_002915 [Rhodothermales bacterium]|jgi:hypothetical protein
MQHLRIGLLFAATISMLAQGQDKVSYDLQVRPILSDKCFFCHGPDEEAIEGKLQLHTFEAATSDRGERGPAIVPGKPEKSLLWHRVTATDPDDVMPPPKRHMAITKKEAAILRQWITEGAEYQALWSFVPLAKEVPVPDSPFSDVRNPVDNFVQSKLATAGLKPTPEAQSDILLRRLHLVTTGLVPTPAEIAEFKADTSGKAYENRIEKLLSSQAFAEHLAVDWLDVARYADSYGYQVDRGRETWQWRDWLLRAFRDNLPYDQFIMQQLAGDLMPDSDDQKLLATAFNRLHGMKVEGGSIEEEFRTEYVADRVQTAGTAFLGLTMECTRCHDHKYDPLTAKDFFGMASLFNNIDESGLLAYFNQSVPSPTMMLMSDGEKAELAKRKQAVADAESAYAEACTAEDAAFAAWRKEWDGNVTPKGQVAYFSFDELVKGKVPNLAPGAKGSVGLGGKLVDDGMQGKAVHFDGDTKMSMGAVGPFARHAAFSISLGINASAAHPRAVILHRSKAWTDAASRGYELMMHKGKLDFALIHFAPGNEIRIRTLAVIPPKTWKRVTVTYDGSARAAGIQIYLDGELAATEIIKDHLNKEIWYSAKKGQQVELAARMRDNGFKNSMIDELAFYNRALSALEVRAIHTPDATSANDDELRAYYLTTASENSQKAHTALAAARASYCGYEDGRKRMMVMREMPERRKTYVLKRGHYSDPDPDQPVEARPPESIFPFGPEYSRDRLGFAQWLVHPEHPLTARVTVNRYWQMLFGRGIVATTNDLGFQGATPTHPKLLDYLSRSFIDSGWDVRALFRQILSSHSFRQDSSASPELLASDPENQQLARGPSFHLTAEALRDSALHASQRLNLQFGGGNASVQSTRRSVYLTVKRNSPAPEMLTFGSSRRQVCAVKREKTSTPLQSLVLLNSPLYVAGARGVAMRVMESKAEDATKLAELFQRLTSRDPQPEEAQVLSELLSSQLAYFRASPEVSKNLNKVGGAIRGPDSPELAAWTTVASAVMNLDSFYMLR